MSGCSFLEKKMKDEVIYRAFGKRAKFLVTRDSMSFWVCIFSQ